MILKAIIGANYGDEGKGLFTDYWAMRLRDEGQKVTVIRHSGGAQAGHTVVRSDGARHVFGHLGSGSLSGAGTHLSRYFIVNPMMFQRELGNFLRLGREFIGIWRPRVTVDRNAIVTTPWDMLTNQWLETHRGGDRHGSCGMGINETYVRSETYPFSVKDLYELSDQELRSYCADVESYHTKIRLPRLGVELTPQMRAELYGTNWTAVFCHARDYFVQNTAILDDELIGDLGNALIFEGAQGLGLHESRGHFPHVTRARTGMENVTALIEQAGFVDPIEVFYATRSYLTRHGAGPTDWEGPVFNTVTVDDPTNKPNKWQESLRDQPLNIKAVAKRIQEDLDCSAPYPMQVNLAVSHLDFELLSHRHPPTEMLWYGDGNVCMPGTRGDLIADLSHEVDVAVKTGLYSFGPKAEDVWTGEELLNSELGSEVYARTNRPYAERFPAKQEQTA